MPCPHDRSLPLPGVPPPRPPPGPPPPEAFLPLLIPEWVFCVDEEDEEEEEEEEEKEDDMGPLLPVWVFCLGTPLNNFLLFSFVPPSMRKSQ